MTHRQASPPSLPLSLPLSLSPPLSLSNRSNPAEKTLGRDGARCLVVVSPKITTTSRTEAKGRHANVLILIFGQQFPP